MTFKTSRGAAAMLDIMKPPLLAVASKISSSLSATFLAEADEGGVPAACRGSGREVLLRQGDVLSDALGQLDDAHG